MMSDNNVESSPLRGSHQLARTQQKLPQPSEPQSWLDLWGPRQQKEVKNNCYHAHFDCFSGIAGDMILASCIDAAGAAGDASSGSGDQLLKLVEVCLRKGLPELDGEFEIQKQRVWRGSGQIAATRITVHSRYERELGGTAPAPLPLKASQESEQQQPQRQDFSPSVSPVPSSMGSHSHAHEHSHQHDHQHEHYHHSHSHVHQQQSTDSSVCDQNTVDGGAAVATSISGGNHGLTHSHGGQNRGPLRNLPEIRRMLNAAPEAWIPSWVRKTAIKSFTLLAVAEAEVHGADSLDSVHFHEVGVVDSIVDMVGSLLALHALGVRSVSCSRLPIGEGHVQTDHGLMPVPAPAALRLMMGMPTTPGPPGYTGELVTPTGAALIRALIAGGDDDNDSDSRVDGSRSSSTNNNNNNNASASSLAAAASASAPPGRPPRFTLRKLGIGAGSKDFVNHPNILRLLLGDCLTDDTIPNQVFASS
jgi:pyridinium-3,5-bisthiocarboxylic acid mononucleotide nickel chelatase